MLRQGSTRCGRELFAAYGIQLEPVPADSTTPALAFLTVAGFAGARLGGFVALGADESILRRSNSTPSTLSDWIAELGNQFLGRIKNCLLREGITIHRVPPAVIRAGIPATLCVRPSVQAVRLADGQDAIWIWMDWETNLTSDDSAPLSAEDTAVLAEGEMLLF